MVTKRRKPPQKRPTERRLFIKEWVKFRKLRSVDVADYVGIERESFYRWIREQDRITTEKMAKLAKILQCEPADLWFHPTARRDLDRIAARLDDDAYNLAVQMVERLAGPVQ